MEEAEETWVARSGGSTACYAQARDRASWLIRMQATIQTAHYIFGIVYNPYDIETLGCMEGHAYWAAFLSRAVKGNGEAGIQSIRHRDLKDQLWIIVSLYEWRNQLLYCFFQDKGGGRARTWVS